eukprot:gene10348-7241_t
MGSNVSTSATPLTLDAVLWNPIHVGDRQPSSSHMHGSTTTTAPSSSQQHQQPSHHGHAAMLSPSGRGSGSPRSDRHVGFCLSKEQQQQLAAGGALAEGNAGTGTGTGAGGARNSREQGGGSLVRDASLEDTALEQVLRSCATPAAGEKPDGSYQRSLPPSTAVATAAAEDTSEYFTAVDHTLHAFRLSYTFGGFPTPQGASASHHPTTSTNTNTFGTTTTTTTTTAAGPLTPSGRSPRSARGGGFVPHAAGTTMGSSVRPHSPAAGSGPEGMAASTTAPPSASQRAFVEVLTSAGIPAGVAATVCCEPVLLSASEVPLKSSDAYVVVHLHRTLPSLPLVLATTTTTTAGSTSSPHALGSGALDDRTSPRPPLSPTPAAPNTRCNSGGGTAGGSRVAHRSAGLPYSLHHHAPRGASGGGAGSGAGGGASSSAAVSSSSGGVAPSSARGAAAAAAHLLPSWVLTVAEVCTPRGLTGAFATDMGKPLFQFDAAPASTLPAVAGARGPGAGLPPWVSVEAEDAEEEQSPPFTRSSTGEELAGPYSDPSPVRSSSGIVVPRYPKGAKEGDVLLRESSADAPAAAAAAVSHAGRTVAATCGGGAWRSRSDSISPPAGAEENATTTPPRLPPLAQHYHYGVHILSGNKAHPFLCATAVVLCEQLDRALQASAALRQALFVPSYPIGPSPKESPLPHATPHPTPPQQQRSAGAAPSPRLHHGGIGSASTSAVLPLSPASAEGNQNQAPNTNSGSGTLPDERCLRTGQRSPSHPPATLHGIRGGRVGNITHKRSRKAPPKENAREQRPAVASRKYSMRFLKLFAVAGANATGIAAPQQRGVGVSGAASPLPLPPSLPTAASYPHGNGGIVLSPSSITPAGSGGLWVPACDAALGAEGSSQGLSLGGLSSTIPSGGYHTWWSRPQPPPPPQLSQLNSSSSSPYSPRAGFGNAGRPLSRPGSVASTPRQWLLSSTTPLCLSPHPLAGSGQMSKALGSATGPNGSPSSGIVEGYNKVQWRSPVSAAGGGGMRRLSIGLSELEQLAGTYPSPPHSGNALLPQLQTGVRKAIRANTGNGMTPRAATSTGGKQPGAPTGTDNGRQRAITLTSEQKQQQQQQQQAAAAAATKRRREESSETAPAAADPEELADGVGGLFAITKLRLGTPPGMSTRDDSEPQPEELEALQQTNMNAHHGSSAPPGAYEKDDSTSRGRSNSSETDEIWMTKNRAERMKQSAPEATEIFPFLFVGGETAARDEEQLLTKGITGIVNTVAFDLPCYFEENFRYLPLFLQDRPDELLYTLIPLVNQFVEEERAKGGNVFIHCHQGVSRSCSFVIGYAMWYQGWCYDRAYEYVRARRTICSPNAGFYVMLQFWEQQLRRGPAAQSRGFAYSPFNPPHAVPRSFCLALELYEDQAAQDAAVEADDSGAVLHRGHMQRVQRGSDCTMDPRLPYGFLLYDAAADAYESVLLLPSLKLVGASTGDVRAAEARMMDPSVLREAWEQHLFYSFYTHDPSTSTNNRGEEVSFQPVHLQGVWRAHRSEGNEEEDEQKADAHVPVATTHVMSDPREVVRRLQLLYCTAEKKVEEVDASAKERLLEEAWPSAKFHCSDPDPRWDEVLLQEPEVRSPTPTPPPPPFAPAPSSTTPSSSGLVQRVAAYEKALRDANTREAAMARQKTREMRLAGLLALSPVPRMCARHPQSSGTTEGTGLGTAEFSSSLPLPLPDSPGGRRNTGPATYSNRPSGNSTVPAGGCRPRQSSPSAASSTTMTPRSRVAHTARRPDRPPRSGYQRPEEAVLGAAPLQTSVTNTFTREGPSALTARRALPGPPSGELHLALDLDGGDASDSRQDHGAYDVLGEDELQDEFEMDGDDLGTNEEEPNSYDASLSPPADSSPTAVPPPLAAHEMDVTVLPYPFTGATPLDGLLGIGDLDATQCYSIYLPSDTTPKWYIWIGQDCEVAVSDAQAAFQQYVEGGREGMSGEEDVTRLPHQPNMLVPEVVMDGHEPDDLLLAID